MSNARDFSSEQQAAIDVSRLGQDACVVAGPGSGKTTVLVERYRQLVARGISPGNILAITFTEKAAANMKKRIAASFSDNAALRNEIEKAAIATVDAFCARLLREHAVAAGVDPEFAVLDDRMARIERARCARLALDQVLEERRPAALSLIHSLANAAIAPQMPAIYEAVRSAGIAISDLREYPVPSYPGVPAVLEALAAFIQEQRQTARTPAQKRRLEEAQEIFARLRGSSPERLETLAMLQSCQALKLTALGSDLAKGYLGNAKELAELTRAGLIREGHADELDTLFRVFERMDELFTQRKRELGALDFADLNVFTIRLLENHPELRDHIAGQFQQVFMDEFQDTNGLQKRLLGLLRNPGTFYAVGDINQSIFGFRHARPQVFRDYRDEVRQGDLHLTELRDNWRSRAAILRAAETIAEGTEGIEQHRLHPRRELPAKQEPSVEVISVRAAQNGEVVEAQWSAQRVGELCATLRIGEDRRRARLSDFAVLARNSSTLEVYAREFRKAGIPVRLTRGGQFFDDRDVEDLLSLLFMLANPLDDLATAAVLRSPFCGLSDEALFHIKQKSSFTAALRDPDHAALQSLDAVDRERLRDFALRFERWRARAAYLPAGQLLTAALDESGLVWDARSVTGENIEGFLALLRSFAPATPLAEIARHVELIRKDPRDPNAAIDDSADGVRLMTAHASKGLEFPVVIIAGMNRSGKDNNSDLLNFHPDQGLGVKWAENGDLVFINNQEIQTLMDDHETNRLLYVALTRAEEHLVLAWHNSGSWAGAAAARLQLGEVELDGQPRIRTLTSPHGLEFEVRVLGASQSPAARTRFDAGDALEAPQELPAPPLNAQHDTAATATSLTVFAACPRRYYLANDLGWSRPAARRLVEIEEANEDAADEPGDSPLHAGELGTQVHRLLAGLPVPDAKLDWRAAGMAQTFERSTLGKRARAAKRQEREYSFLFALQDLVISGSIDLWFEDGKKLVLVDYKTDDVSAAEVPERAREYTLQLQLYALALEQLHGRRPAEAWLHFLRPDVTTPVALNFDGAELRGLVRDFLHAQESHAFPLVIADHCRRCPFYRNLCPAVLES